MYRIRRNERDNTMNNRLELSARPGVQHQQLPSISHRSRISRAYPSASRADRSTPARWRGGNDVMPDDGPAAGTLTMTPRVRVEKL